jgi:hypothetical protein
MCYSHRRIDHLQHTQSGTHESTSTRAGTVLYIYLVQSEGCFYWVRVRGAHHPCHVQALVERVVVHCHAVLLASDSAALWLLPRDKTERALGQLDRGARSAGAQRRQACQYRHQTHSCIAAVGQLAANLRRRATSDRGIARSLDAPRRYKEDESCRVKNVQIRLCPKPREALRNASVVLTRYVVPFLMLATN